MKLKQKNKLINFTFTDLLAILLGILGALLLGLIVLGVVCFITK